MMNEQKQPANRGAVAVAVTAVAAASPTSARAPGATAPAAAAAAALLGGGGDADGSLPTIFDAARRASAIVVDWSAMSDEALAREVDALRAAIRTLAAALPQAAAAAAAAAFEETAAEEAAAAAPHDDDDGDGGGHAGICRAQQQQQAEEESGGGAARGDNAANTADDNADNDEWQVPPNSIPIHADVRTFDWPRLAAAAQFDVVLMDPPWQLATANPTRGVALGYSQLADADILRLPVPQLQRRGGFLCVWVINAKYKFTLDLFDAWGYTLVDEIVWVKSTVNRRLAKSHGYYLQHAKETCLVAFRPGGNAGGGGNGGAAAAAAAAAAASRGPAAAVAKAAAPRSIDENRSAASPPIDRSMMSIDRQQQNRSTADQLSPEEEEEEEEEDLGPPMPWELAVAARMRGGEANGTSSSSLWTSDVIFAERRGQSEKPKELYELIEELIPRGRYLEIFARKNNLRDGWVSIGNEVTGMGPPLPNADNGQQR